MDLAKNLRRVEDGRRAALLVNVGIPPVYHGRTLAVYLERKLTHFLRRRVMDFDSGLMLIGKTLDDSYRVGARLGELAVNAGVSVAVIGFKALNSVYKASFREPDSKALLKDKFAHNDIIIFVNVGNSTMVAWGDPRDISWFRGIIKHRASSKLKTVICTDVNFSEEKEMSYLLGVENNAFLWQSEIIKIRKAALNVED